MNGSIIQIEYSIYIIHYSQQTFPFRHYSAAVSQQTMLVRGMAIVFPFLIFLQCGSIFLYM